MVSLTSPTKAFVVSASPTSPQPAAPVARHESQRPDGQAREQHAPDGSFVCPICKGRYGDPLYHGPIGHAPQQMCFDCWAGEWASMIQVLARGGDWRQIDSALFLLCQGFKPHEAAKLVGMRRTAVHHWIRKARQKPCMIPEWLIERASSCEKPRV